MRKLLVYVLALLAARSAVGATYYVDSSAGNDAWPGTQSSVSTTNGPWRSLSRIASASLAPGDTVLLKCGSTWNESLRISTSGTSANPITIGRYPAGCGNNPVIDGTTTVPANSWRHYAGGIYRASLPVNLIRNPQFDQGTSYWTSWSAAGTQRLETDSACGTTSSSCMKFTSAAGTSLATSNTFEVRGGETLSIAFRAQIPSGVRVRAILRRGSEPWDHLGFSPFIDGTGAWQSLVFTAVASNSAGNARLDFEVPGGAKVIRLDDVRITGPGFVPRQLFAGSRKLLHAHHPNRGDNPSQPTSLFARVAVNSDRTTVDGKLVSTYVTVGSDLQLPSGQVLTPGLGIAIRLNNWVIDERTITSVAGDRLYLNAPTTYEVDKDWGYYLTGAFWMLDRPGEWFYDAATRELYAWMFDGDSPPDVVAGHRLTGIDMSGRGYVTIEGLHIRGFDTAVQMQKSIGGRVLNTTIFDSAQYGINTHWSTAARIEQNQITNTGRDAITGFVSTGGPAADGMIVQNNVIAHSGMRNADPINDLPIRSYAAILAGTNALVAGNDVRHTGYIGIRPFANGRVERNYVANTCIVLNDCGAIHLTGPNNNGATISRNIVVDSIGNLDGVPFGDTMAQGIYIDDLSTNVRIEGNTVARTDHGIQIHDASYNVIQGNTLYGNRRSQLWMQEDTTKTRASGDLWGNNVVSNRLFPVSASPSVLQETLFAGTVNFASYSSNRYSTLLSPIIAAERWATGTSSYTLPEWQAARTSTGTPRNLDIGATQVANLGYAPFRVMGTNILPNGNLAKGKVGWTAWNSTAPYGIMALEGCPQGQCLRYTAGSTLSLLSTPNFSVVKDVWYRVSFDAKTAIAGQGISVTVRRGGGGSNGYELLNASAVNFTGATTWKRFAFAFKAAKTVNAADPVTLDLGARIDFDSIQPSQMIIVGNVQVVPLAAVETTLQTRILANPTAAAQNIDCPDQDSNPTLCSQFVRFSDGEIVYWPQQIPAYGSEIVYSRDPSLIDSDGDGIADSQDACPGTPAGAMTTARGCSFEQHPNG